MTARASTAMTAAEAAPDGVLGEVRREVCASCTPSWCKSGLVAWTSGNTCPRGFPGTELMVIKPSGVSYDDLTPQVHGGVRPGGRAGRRRTATARPVIPPAHAYVYRHLPHVGGVVHTHSTYASAWAARGEPVPCVLTAIADEFGGEIPIGPFALIGGDEIGQGIVATLTGHRSPAVLMRSHGVFTIGGTAKDAVKAAVMCEDVARTVHPLPARKAPGAAYRSRDGRAPPAIQRSLRSALTQPCETPAATPHLPWLRALFRRFC